jgi:L-lactate dehydrogenase
MQSHCRSGRPGQGFLTVSTLLDGQYGITGVCLSVPAIVDGKGIRRVLPMALSESEVAELRRSADAIRATIADAGLDPG